jgi:DNA repair exonuclease SbcCD nuclease subunit
MSRAFLSEDAAPRFAQARIDAIRRLGELASEHEASFIVVAGDVFESNQLSRQTLLRTVDALNNLPVPIFLLPGNHDPLDAGSIFNASEFKQAGQHICVIRDGRALPVPGLDGVEIVGSVWRTKHPSTDLCGAVLKQLAPADQGLRIMVAHGQVDSLAPDKDRPEIIDQARAEQALADGLIHYLALGDRHSMTSVGSTNRIWYSGAPLVTAFDEVDPNKALLVELLAGGDCRVEPLDVGDWVFLAEHFQMNGPDDLQQFAQWLEALANKERTVIKVSFEGSINLATAAELDELMERNAERFASLRRRERLTDLAIVPDELDQDSVALAGYAKAAWDELIALAQEGQPAAQDALRLFYRLSRQEGV